MCTKIRECREICAPTINQSNRIMTKSDLKFLQSIHKSHLKVIRESCESKKGFKHYEYERRVKQAEKTASEILEQLMAK